MKRTKESKPKFQMNKAYSGLSPDQFKKWFNNRKEWEGEDWKVYYKQIGGTIPEETK
jgi:hypothetical protein